MGGPVLTETTNSSRQDSAQWQLLPSTRPGQHRAGLARRRSLCWQGHEAALHVLCVRQPTWWDTVPLAQARLSPAQSQP